MALTGIVEYKPGAGGRVLTNYIYNLSPPNGLEIARVDNGTPTANLVGDSAVKFQADKFNWIGSFATDKWVLVMRAGAGVESLSQLKSSQKPPKIGSISAVHKTFTNARLLEKLLNVKFDMVTGYPGGNDINLAMTRQEVDGTVAAYVGFMQRNLSAYQAGQFFAIVQSGNGLHHDALPALNDVPVIWNLVSPENLPVLQAAAVPWDSAFVLPPKTPPEIVNVLRKAFENLSKDSDFIAQYKKDVGDDVSFSSGGEIEEGVRTILKASPQTIETLKSLFVKE